MIKPSSAKAVITVLTGILLINSCKNHKDEQLKANKELIQISLDRQRPLYDSIYAHDFIKAYELYGPFRAFLEESEYGMELLATLNAGLETQFYVEMFDRIDKLTISEEQVEHLGKLVAEIVTPSNKEMLTGNYKQFAKEVREIRAASE